jgi:hypothetical protein
MLEKVLIFILALAIAVFLTCAGLLFSRRLRKRLEEETAERELADLLDEWNRKHRPDLWARGGNWPEGSDSGSRDQEAFTAC